MVHNREQATQDPCLGMPFVYQTVRCSGLRPLYLEEHLVLLRQTVMQVFGEDTDFTPLECREAISLVLRINNYPAHSCNTVMVRAYAHGNWTVEATGTLLYDRLGIRALHPEGKQLLSQPVLAGLATSSALASHEMSRTWAQCHHYGVALETDSEGNILAVDGGQSIGVKDGALIIPHPVYSVEMTLLMKAAHKAGRRIICHEPLRMDSLEELRELWGIDHRGIIAVQSVGEKFFTDITATVLASKLE